MRTSKDRYQSGPINWIADATAGPLAGMSLKNGEVVALTGADGRGLAVKFQAIEHKGERTHPVVRLEGKPALAALVEAEQKRVEAKESAARKLEAEMKKLPDSACFDVERPIGESFRRGDAWWTVLGYTRRQRWDNFEDEMVWKQLAGCRPATETEIAAGVARIAASAEAKRARAELDTIARDLRERGDRPEGSNSPEGVEIAAGGSERAFGGGKWFVLGSEWIWFIQNNGGDGDDWSCNNVSTGGAGAIGWRVPHDPELAARIGKLAALGYPGG
jgi:hypothetical protein